MVTYWSPICALGSPGPSCFVYRASVEREIYPNARFYLEESWSTRERLSISDAVRSPAEVSSDAGETGRSVSERQARCEDTANGQCRVNIDDVTFGVRWIIVEGHQYRERDDSDKRECRDRGSRDRPRHPGACHPR